MSAVRVASQGLTQCFVYGTGQEWFQKLTTVHRTTTGEELQFLSHAPLFFFAACTVISGSILVDKDTSKSRIFSFSLVISEVTEA